MLSERGHRPGARRSGVEAIELPASHHVTLLPGPEEFDASPDEDLLTAALRGGVPVMYGCRHGNCGTCLHYLVDGDVAEGTTSPYVLSSEAREQGALLLCSSYARGDVVVERPAQEGTFDDEDLIPPESRLAEVVAVASLSPSLVELRCRLAKPLSFRAGQYVEVWIPGIDQRRSLSIASPPASGDELTFLLTLLPGGRLAQSVGRLREGDVMRLQGPFGHFAFRDSGRPVVMVALGSGIAPIMSMLRDASERTTRPTISLYYGGPADERAYVYELEELSELLPGLGLLLAPPRGNGGTDIGALTQLVACELRDGSSHDAYVCGQPALCDALSALLAAKGMPERHIRVEKFYSAVTSG